MNSFESGRAVKINQNDQVNHSANWKESCQGVLIDSKTVVTTADCVIDMPETGKF